MTHCRICGILEDVGEEVICEDCADKMEKGGVMTPSELLDNLELWRREKQKRDKSSLIHTNNLRTKINALRQILSDNK